MLRVTCPNCRNRLSAKEKLIGQTRNCPACGMPLRITPDPADPGEQIPDAVPIEDALTDAHVVAPPDEALPLEIHRPERMARENRYLIFNSERLIATWENDGQGWMFHTGAGFLSVHRNQDKLPSQGNFTFVELRFAIAEDGLRLHGVMAYRLVKHWALPSLARGDEAILQKVETYGSLNKAQKFAICQYLQEEFMRAVWTSIPEVHDYLTNGDYHSPGVDVPLRSS
jgi:hypothetical protein